VLPTGALGGRPVEVADPVGVAGAVGVARAVGEPPVVPEADADGPGDDETSATPWSEAWKEQPPTLSTARRTAAVRTDARVMTER
jgi:hypothetical protein